MICCVCGKKIVGEMPVLDNQKYFHAQCWARKKSGEHLSDNILDFAVRPLMGSEYHRARGPDYPHCVSESSDSLNLSKNHRSGELPNPASQGQCAMGVLLHFGQR